MDLKRIFDIVFSSVVLVAGAPIFLLCALIVKCTSQGPIFHACERVGRNGVSFRCWKYRTMVVDAEVLLPVILANNTALFQEWRTFHKLKQDPRITSVGKWFRRTSLDELPQFWNVLRGEMSIVGPRPMTRDQVEEYLKGNAADILSLRPGLTSLWAMSGRNEVSFARRVYLEQQYVRTRSLILDLRLIWKTFVSMFTLRGAF